MKLFTKRKGVPVEAVGLGRQFCTVKEARHKTAPLPAITSQMTGDNGSDLAGLGGVWAGFTSVAGEYPREY